MASSRRVRFTDYAIFKLRRRDILVEEVLLALERPTSAHRQRRDGRSEVRIRLPKGRLLVVYRRRTNGLLVINAMWE
jgi:hypothetical protein